MPTLGSHADGANGLREERRAVLEKCVYCPKLCRAACPVSNATPTESLTPWGKMSTAYFLARGDIEPVPDTASLAWACTGCFACRERCDHKNPVEATLVETRADLFASGAAPAAAREVAENADRRARETSESAGRLRETVARKGAPVKLLVGCSYLRKAPEEAAQAVAVTKALVGEDVDVVEACCGYPARAAGDARGFEAAKREMARAVETAARFIVLDAGCARTLLQEYGDTPIKAPELLVDVAAASLDRFSTIESASTLRYHDPCQLGRGLQRYEEPRAILKRLLGAPVAEFERAREAADCSGGGSILPRTMPETSATIAEQRKTEHERLGGGAVVTACAGSLRRFRKSGVDVVDLVSLMARGLGIDTTAGKG
ncbi:MAG: (Fe-S)-binding protein [Myxococcales bacterium]|nr:(Fe-S)-binding protein [Myxococcales bacterium]